MPLLKYQGCSLFRQRIICALLSGNSLRIDKIRSQDLSPGLQDFEANFLRLVESLTDGCGIEINETGTTLRFKPGIPIGGVFEHDCGLSRSIGWFIEGIIPLAIFCKNPVSLTLTGITNDQIDISVDILQQVTIPLLQNFGIAGITMKVKSRGAPPKGGGIVFIQITPIRGALKPIQVVDEGLIRRVRGVAFCTKISPAIATRVVDSCRGVLNKFLPDVRIHVDHYQGGRGGGNSPGYSLSLVAETTTGVLLSVERTAKSRAPSVTNSADLSNFTQSEEKGESHVAGELPETIGREGGLLLLREIQKGGVIDSFHQPLVLLLMALTPEDVSKVRFGVLTQQSVRLLRLLKDSFGVIFKIRPDFQTSPGPNVPVETRRKRENTLTTSETTGKRKKTLGNSSESESENEGFNQGFEQNQHCDHLVDIDRATILLSCYGSGYANVSRKAT